MYIISITIIYITTISVLYKIHYLLKNTLTILKWRFKYMEENLEDVVYEEKNYKVIPITIALITAGFFVC